MRTLQQVHSQNNGPAVDCEVLPPSSDRRDSHGNRIQAEELDGLLPPGFHVRLPMNPSFRRVLTFVSANYMNRLTLDLVAQHVYLNRTYVSQLFSKYLGVSFVTYLECIRISRAQELLVNTDLSVAEIAVEIGYANASYFAKVFKKRVGVTPFGYRHLDTADELPWTTVKTGHSFDNVIG